MSVLWKAFPDVHLLDLQGLQHTSLAQTTFPPTKCWGRSFFLSPVLSYAPNVPLGHSFWSPMELCRVPRHLTFVSRELLSYITSLVLMLHIFLVSCQTPSLPGAH